MTSGPDGVAGGGLLIGFYVMCAALVAGLIAVTAFAVVR